MVWVVDETKTFVIRLEPVAPKPSVAGLAIGFGVLLALAAGSLLRNKTYIHRTPGERR